MKALTSILCALLLPLVFCSAVFINSYRFGGGGGGGGGDPYFADVVLLAHMDGANNGTTFTDSSSYARTLTAYVGAKTSTAQSKFGGSSGAFYSYDTVKASNAAELNFGTGDFTIEFFYRWSTVPGYHTVYDNGWTSTGALLILSGATAGKWEIYMSGTMVLAETSATPSAGVWYYYAFVRSGTTLTIYRDGVAAGSTTNSSNISTTNGTAIGSKYDDGNHGCIGNLDEYRVTKGVARNVSTVPTAAFPDS